ncbi:hypothetical protein ACFHYO_13150 [Paracoccus panacisoli]|uniref:DUF429 domain-containing protein n=1 Tax=Paracoccus panacisoli TaxID=1510163 RepID=A0ABV6T822_9RHOB|nr:hypothetical protein [Paracoccus sanguinis]
MRGAAVGAGFDILVHSDWGALPAARWSAVAARAGDGWRVVLLEPAGDLAVRLPALSATGRVLAGFDFPIGVPASYGALTGLDGFEDLLARIGRGAWADWGLVCQEAGQIAIHRPFYPQTGGVKGTVKKAHLETGLGLTLADLRRGCEAGGGEILFWTLGPKSVGKAAIHGLESTVQPLCAEGARLWPFHGTLADLASTRLVLAETYPALSYASICGTKMVDKGNALSLRRLTDKVMESCARLGVELPDPVAARITAGFEVSAGSAKANSDEFDALIGLLGMIEALGRPEVITHEPGPDAVHWEGWMLNGVA